MGANNVSLLLPLYAWSRCGLRAHARAAPRNWGKNVTLLCRASRPEASIGPCLAVEDATTREVFETYYLEHVLAPTLKPGQTVDPIEQAFSKVKGLMRKAEAHPRGAD